MWGGSAGRLLTSDRINGRWTAPVVLTTKLAFPSNYHGVSYRLAGNANGDLVLVWSEADSRYPVRLKTAVRKAAGAWSPSDAAMAPGKQIGLEDVAINAGGTVVVSWESFDANCGPSRCRPSNYALYVSRLVPGSGAWVASPQLGVSSYSGVSGRVAIDDQGRVGVTSESYSSQNQVVAYTQPAVGAAWAGPSTVFIGYGIAGGIGTDNAGHATIAVLRELPSGGPVAAVDGDLATSRWTAPKLLEPTSKLMGQDLQFAVAPDGRAVMSWFSTDGTYKYDGRASVRPATGAPWGPAAALPLPSQFGDYPLAGVAVQAGVKAAVGTFSPLGQSATGFSEYVQVWR